MRSELVVSAPCGKAPADRFDAGRPLTGRDDHLVDQGPSGLEDLLAFTGLEASAQICARFGSSAGVLPGPWTCQDDQPLLGTGDHGVEPATTVALRPPAAGAWAASSILPAAAESSAGKSPVAAPQSGGPRGSDAGKKIKGCERRAIVDTDARADASQPPGRHPRSRWRTSTSGSSRPSMAVRSTAREASGANRGMVAPRQPDAGGFRAGPSPPGPEIPPSAMADQFRSGPDDSGPLKSRPDHSMGAGL